MPCDGMPCHANCVCPSVWVCGSAVSVCLCSCACVGAVSEWVRTRKKFGGFSSVCWVLFIVFVGFGVFVVTFFSCLQTLVQQIHIRKLNTEHDNSVFCFFFSFVFSFCKISVDMWPIAWWQCICKGILWKRVYWNETIADALTTIVALWIELKPNGYNNNKINKTEEKQNDEDRYERTKISKTTTVAATATAASTSASEKNASAFHM